MPLRLPQHRGRKPNTKRDNKASPSATSRYLPYPTDTESSLNGDFSPPTTSHQSPNGPRWRGNSSSLSQADPDPTARAARCPLSAQRTPAMTSSHLLLLLYKRDLPRRAIMAKRAQSFRIRRNKRQHKSMHTDLWSELRSASLPVYHRSKAPSPHLPRSLPNLGWKRDPSHMIRLDLPRGGSFPFPHSPPGSSPQLRRGPFLPDSYSHLSTSPKDGTLPTLPLSLSPPCT